MSSTARSGWILGLACLAVGLHTPHVQSQDGDTPTVRLELATVPGCIDRSGLMAAVSRELDRPAFVESEDAELVARARITPTLDERYRAEVALFTSDGLSLGVRAIESDTSDCRTLDDALAVVFAAVIQVRRADIKALQEANATWSFRAGARAGAVFALLPQVGLEVAGNAGLAWDDTFVFAVELAFDWTDSTPAKEGSIVANAAVARLLFSPVLIDGDAELAWRVSAGAGPMWASAEGFPQVGLHTRLLVEVRTGLGFALHAVGPLWIEMTGDVGVVPLRPKFVVQNANGSTETLFQPPLFLGNLMLGFSVRAE